MPKTKILHIVRDGRANAYSMHTRSSKNLLLSAQNWVDGNVFGLVHQQIVGDEHYKLVRYEDLLINPERELKSICEFLMVDYTPEMLSLSDSELESENSYVKNYFDKSKIDKWKQQLTAREVEKVEQIQAPLLKKLAYELVTPEDRLKYRPLSLPRYLYHKIGGNFKQIFTSKRVGMKDRKSVVIHTPLKKRIHAFLRVFTQEIFSTAIFKSFFSSVFYRKKYFKKEEIKDASSRIEASQPSQPRTNI